MIYDFVYIEDRPTQKIDQLMLSFVFASIICNLASGETHNELGIE
jgi:hypothetical protein